jgi:ATP-dependent DNA helicase RecQ
MHQPYCLSVQEIGRAGRDGQYAEALTLVSEPTGWLDSDDKQRVQFFQDSTRSHYRAVQELVHVIPNQGDVSAIAREFKHGAIALSLLHSAGQLQWNDPFHYTLVSRDVPNLSSQDYSVRQMAQFLTTRICRWQFTLKAFGFAKEAETLAAGCGHCDRCLAHQR